MAAPKNKTFIQFSIKSTNGRVTHFTYFYDSNPFGNLEGEHISYHKLIPEHIEELLKNKQNKNLITIDWTTIGSHKYL